MNPYPQALWGFDLCQSELVPEGQVFFMDGKIVVSNLESFQRDIIESIVFAEMGEEEQVSI